MSEESALSFRKLVNAMRTTEKEYWDTRRRDLLKKALKLEERVDSIIMKADGNDVPQNNNGAFFLEVAQLRASSNLYFQEKKKAKPDNDVIGELYKKIKTAEANIDKMLVRFRDEDIKRQGYRIEYHVMECLYRGKAHSIYHSMDEQLAKLELDDYLGHASHGTLYFLCKKYVGPDGKLVTPPENDD
jgi:hypothetical protein